MGWQGWQAQVHVWTGLIHGSMPCVYTCACMFMHLRVLGHIRSRVPTYESMDGNDTLYELVDIVRKPSGSSDGPRSTQVDVEASAQEVIYTSSPAELMNDPGDTSEATPHASPVYAQVNKSSGEPALRGASAVDGSEDEGPRAALTHPPPLPVRMHRAGTVKQASSDLNSAGGAGGASDPTVQVCTSACPSSVAICTMSLLSLVTPLVTSPCFQSNLEGCIKYLLCVCCLPRFTLPDVSYMFAI